MHLFSETLAFGFVTASVLALAGVGFTIQFGTAGFFNLTYGQVMTACAFIAWFLNARGVNIWVTLPIAAVAGALLSATLNRVVFSPFLKRGMTLYGVLIVTLALGFIIQNVLVVLGGITFFVYQMNPGATYHVLGMPFTSAQLVVIGLALVSMTVLHATLAHTKLGRAIRATAADASLARSCGMNTKVLVDIAWLISGALCGLAGVALAIEIGTFDATTGAFFLPTIVAAAFVGGIGQPYGAMLGALLLGLATEFSAAYLAPQFSSVIALGILVVFILIRPQGMLGSAASHT